MSKSISRLLFSAVALAVLAGCQQSPPQEETTEEPAESMVEESFESGDTGRRIAYRPSRGFPGFRSAPSRGPIGRGGL